jgi:hypothetical protein
MAPSKSRVNRSDRKEHIDEVAAIIWTYLSDDMTISMNSEHFHSD